MEKELIEILAALPTFRDIPEKDIPHLRVNRGWSGKSLAIFAVIGFACVIFTYICVTTLLPGVHNYA